MLFMSVLVCIFVAFNSCMFSISPKYQSWSVFEWMISFFILSVILFVNMTFFPVDWARLRSCQLLPETKIVVDSVGDG